MLKCKKLLAGLLTLVMLPGLTACGGGSGDLTEWEQSADIFSHIDPICTAAQTPLYIELP